MSCATGSSSIQAKIWKGYARAAQKLGESYQFFRPQAGTLGLEGGGNLELEGGGNLQLEGGIQFPGKYLFTLPVSLNAEDMNYRKPNKYGKATWYALFDGKNLKVGDYFIGEVDGGSLLLEGGGYLQLEGGGNMALAAEGGTFFIAAMQLLLPILVVECNRVISIFRPQSQTGKGSQGYSGITAANEIAYAKGVPCSILQGTKGEKNETALPGDTRAPWWTVLVPASVGRVEYGDLIIDDFGQRYVVSSNELSSAGWRLNCAMTIL